MMVFAFYASSRCARLPAGLLLTVISRNPVHSVLWLILGLSVLGQGCSCCWVLNSWRCLLVIVYVGAVAVLFLFVVMMLDVDFSAAEGRNGAVHAAWPC